MQNLCLKKFKELKEILTMKKINIVIFISIITIFIFNINVFAYQETNQDKEHTTFKIYDSINQYEEDQYEEDQYEIVPYSIVTISTLSLIFIRLNNGTDLVEVYFKYVGSNRTNLLEVNNFIVKDSNFLNQKILAEIPHAFVRELADTRVYFKIGEINLPKKFDKVRVDCAQINIYILDFGWYMASDPVGTWEIKK